MRFIDKRACKNHHLTSIVRIVLCQLFPRFNTRNNKRETLNPTASTNQNIPIGRTIRPRGIPEFLRNKPRINHGNIDISNPGKVIFQPRQFRIAMHQYRIEILIQHGHNLLVIPPIKRQILVMYSTKRHGIKPHCVPIASLSKRDSRLQHSTFCPRGNIA